MQGVQNRGAGFNSALVDFQLDAQNSSLFT
jgi:hypothetical protein